MAVGLAFRIAPRILSADLSGRKLVFQESDQWAKRDYKGTLNRVTEGLLRMEFTEAFPIDKSMVLDVLDLNPARVRQISWAGTLFSFNVPMGTAILRGQVKADAGMKNIVTHVINETDDDSDIIEFDCGSEDALPEYWISMTRW